MFKFPKDAENVTRHLKADEQIELLAEMVHQLSSLPMHILKLLLFRVIRDSAIDALEARLVNGEIIEFCPLLMISLSYTLY